VLERSIIHMSIASIKHYARKLVHFLSPKISAARALEHGAGDEIELELLDLLVDPSREAIDVGGNWGQYASRIAKLARHVVVIEPNPQLAYVLRRTLPANVTVDQIAASTSSGQMTLFVPYNQEALATVEGHDVSDGERIKVQTVPIDDYANRDIGFVKIDVEGHELDVLAGATRLIGRCRPIFLVEAEERHQNGATHRLFAYFAQRDYVGFFVDNYQLHEVSCFDPALFQNPQLLRDYARRRDARYVNNFTFLAADQKLDGIVRRVAGRLAKLKGEHRQRTGDGRRNIL
jgi:FkbM family methyltransferase